MELAIPFIAMGGLYMITKQENNNVEELEEGFEGYHNLPNKNVHDENFPDKRPMETPELSVTEQLSQNNQYEGSAYSDKYFDKTKIENRDSSVITPMNDQSRSFTSLTGEKVDNSYFQHNNQVPFFGKKKTTPNFDANQNEGIMDTYLGKGSQHIEKKEQSPLFAPNDN